jgi:hypothetical protein
MITTRDRPASLADITAAIGSSDAAPVASTEVPS